MFSLTKLAELATDTSATGRKSLVSAVTDMFMTADKDRVEQISLIFGDIVLKVLGQLEHEARLALAKRVSEHDQAPTKLMKALATDEADVAAPVLQNSPVFDADDLVDIASNATMDHLVAIAKRKKIEEKVTSVLVERGDDKVLTTVAENEGARFYDEAFELLVQRAKAVPAIQEALISRKDLPHDAARHLVPFLSHELAERVKSLGADSVLVEVMAERAAEEVTARARRLEDEREQTNKIINEVAAGTRKIDDAVAYFAKQDKAAELGMLLAKVSHLPLGSVSTLIYSKSDKPLIILCKANDVSEMAYKSVLTMRAKRLNLGGLELNEAIKRYASLPKSGAVRSLESIKEAARQAHPEPAKDDTEKDIPFAVHR
ncbi:uncharacterized protein DUF2336 [Roseibium hamelinense]|uniref:Uncharacterized protein DUF2336 n=1 Tax=Roseibium hamelinense TaxID=150831 RepID=A0A562TAH6_9HYPH|nr:DUF2336 domain-containing protein [Roseibium hamelinense]MTI45468.1 DUF2336 domain-containing protein [Roseibium hamelinense]TWI90158.1 uncharacterized protein DUF2336 [Roseibium hamelinense]